jgi:hypothetical protein
LAPSTTQIGGVAVAINVRRRRIADLLHEQTEREDRADLLLGRRIRAKNTRAARAERERDNREARQAADDRLTTITNAYRRRHPLSRDYSTRALAIYVAGKVGGNVHTIRKALRRLGLR